MADGPILAIDQGTSSTKALVVTADGRRLAEARVEIDPRSARPGEVEQDPGEVLDSIVASGREALRRAGEPVVAVGLANQGETVLLRDPASNRPLGPALSWQDRRASSVIAGLDAEGGRLTEITGLPLDPYFSAPKMAWLEASGAKGAAAPIDAWLNAELCGRFVTDAATASRTLLLDLRRGDWSSEACETFGIGQAGLPEVVDCAGPLGETTAFGPTLPLTSLIVDQQAALFAESCLRPGQAKCTYGTGAFLLAMAGEEVPRSVAGLAASIAWRFGGRTSFCLDGQVFTAGSLVPWMSQLGLLGGVEEIAEVAAAGLHPGAAGSALFVPGLAGLGAPFAEPDARGGWVGLSLASGRQEMVRAVLWGIVANVAWLQRSVADALGAAPSVMRVDGGLSRSDSLMQAQADLLQVCVERFPATDATALGVAALTRIGSGGAETAEEAVIEQTPDRVFEPEIEPERADELLARWERAARLMAEFGSGGGA
jgi:glycerol kinase